MKKEVQMLLQKISTKKFWHYNYYIQTVEKFLGNWNRLYTRSAPVINLLGKEQARQIVAVRYFVPSTIRISK